MTTDSELMEHAFRLLYPARAFVYTARINYSGKFSDYNANVRLRGNFIEANLSSKWKNVSEEIKIGLLQELYLKLLRRQKNEKINSFYLDLYNNFVKNIHIAVPKFQGDAVLEESFARVNERYFLGMAEKPNLSWGYFSKRKLGSYDFKRDEITMSSVFKQLEPKFLDAVMYHEVLHKQNKFRSTNGRNLYHDKKFRKAERVFDDYSDVEKELRDALSRIRRPREERLPFQAKSGKRNFLSFVKQLF